MIELGLTSSGNPEARQVATPPAVYLDHWALRMISGDPALAARFAATMHSRAGTLTLSWVSLLEFAKVHSADQRREAERLLHSLLPRLYFLEANPFVVVKREDELLAGGPHVAPHGDADPLAVLLTLNRESLAPLSVEGLLGGLPDSDLSKQMEELGEVFIHQITQMRNDVAKNPALANSMKAIPIRPEVQAGTRWLIREFVRPLIADLRKQITTNDAMDFFHAVVPVAYCQYVLLDGHWAAQANQISSRFKKVGLKVPMAMVLTGGRPGIEELLGQLEDHDI